MYRHHPGYIRVMQLMHHLVFDIFNIASRMVADKFYKPVGVAPSGRFVTDQMFCMMVKHFTNTRI